MVQVVAEDRPDERETRLARRCADYSRRTSAREKQPFTAPPLSIRPDGTPEPRLHDLFSSRSFREQPIFDAKKLVAQLERTPHLGERERVAMDPVLMLAYRAGLARERFGL